MASAMVAAICSSSLWRSGCLRKLDWFIGSTNMWTVMGGELRLAALPRWRGEAGRLEVWYATLSDPVTGSGLWAHYETVAPTTGAAYAHGWASWFPADGPPRTERFGPEPVVPGAGPDWL